MICTGNCNQGRRCDCAPTPAYHMSDWLVLKRWKRARAMRRANILAVAVLVVLLAAVALGLI